MNADFIRATLHQNPRLFVRIAQFNQHPARCLHPDHRPAGLDQKLFARLVAHPRGESHISRWIERAYGLDPRGCWDFSTVSWRLALLPPDDLQRLKRLCAAAEVHASIAALVDGARIRAVKQQIGAEAYEFALRRAPLLAGNVPPRAGVPTADDLPSVLAESGRRALAVCLAGAPAELLQRLALRLPAGQPLAVPSSGDEDQTRTWRRVRRILASEFDPEWTPCWN